MSVACEGPTEKAKIVSVRATPINIPLEAPYRWSPGVMPGFTKTIVEVRTEDGVVGLGEAPGYRTGWLIDSEIGPKIIGANPFDAADCERRCLPPVHRSRNMEDGLVMQAWGGVEMALWDLVGKYQGRSVASLLGGRIRDQIGFTEYFALRLPSEGRGGESTPTDIARYCARMVEEHGADSFEGKVGVLDVATEVKTVKEIRAAVGDDPFLRLDANMAWSTTVARDALHRLEQYNVRSIEDPVATHEEMARLRSSTSIAFSSHAPSLFEAVKLGVPDAFVIGLTPLGGIRRTVKLIHACEGLGIDVWFFSPDAGVASAAYLQVSAGMEHLSQPHQTLARWHMDEVITGGPFMPKDGLVSVPDGPGLGVSLDVAALKRCHERFADLGPYNYYEADPLRRDRRHRG